jgi:hypothetical protein
MMEEKEEEEEAKNPCGVPECLVDMNKRIKNNGGWSSG